jgi:predicted DCC family thiol-disulfide oxidoreductase YuxK
VPLLLFDGDCSVCRAIAAWVVRSAQKDPRGPGLAAQPIGHDPAALTLLHPGLSIWDAYKHLHLCMPGGTLKLDGEAVAEVLRRLPATRWFAWSFNVGVAGFRPGQGVLNVLYFILADLRPLLGCESCGSTSFWAGPIGWTHQQWKLFLGRMRHKDRSPHFRPILVKPPSRP